MGIVLSEGSEVVPTDLENKLIDDDLDIWHLPHVESAIYLSDYHSPTKFTVAEKRKFKQTAIAVSTLIIITGA